MPPSDAPFVQEFVDIGGHRTCVVQRGGASTAAVLVCGGVGFGMSGPRYLLALLGSSLAREGLTVWHYDHPADGDAPGDLASPRLVDLEATAAAVVALARSRGAERVGVIGYGVGNVVAVLLAQQGLIDAVARLAPTRRAWTTSAGWTQAAAHSIGGVTVPTLDDAGTPLNDVWRAIVGEPIVPVQSPGPVSSALLADAAGVDVSEVERQLAMPLLTLSDDPEDGHHGRFELLPEGSSVDRPSWHWMAEARAQVDEAVTSWLVEVLKPGRVSAADAWPAPVASMAGSSRTAVELVVDGTRMAGVLDRHDEEPTAPIGVVYEPGNPGDRVDIHRCGPLLAERLASAGRPVLRYDARGMGLSDGDFADMTWSGRVDDGVAAARHLVDTGIAERVVIVGHSAGARVALRVARLVPEVAGVVLWSPVLVDIDGDVQRPRLRRDPQRGLVAEYCGLWLGLGYSADAREYDDLAELAACTVPLHIAFAADDWVENKAAVLAAASGLRSVDVVTAAGGHGFSWDGMREVLDHTVRFVDSVAVSRAVVSASEAP